MPKTNKEIMESFIDKFNEKYGFKIEKFEYSKLFDILDKIEKNDEYEYETAADTYKLLGEYLVNDCAKSIIEDYKKTGSINKNAKDAFKDIPLFLTQFKLLFLENKMSEVDFDKVNVLGKLTDGSTKDTYNDIIRDTFEKKGFNNFSMLDDILKEPTTKNTSLFADNLKVDATSIGITNKDDPRFHRICAGYTVAKDKLSNMGFFKKYFSSEGRKIRSAISKSESVINKVKKEYDKNMLEKNKYYKPNSLESFVKSSYGVSSILDQFKNNVTLGYNDNIDFRNCALSQIARDMFNIYNSAQIEVQTEIQQEDRTKVVYKKEDLENFNQILDNIEVKEQIIGDNVPTIEANQRTN